MASREAQKLIKAARSGDAVARFRLGRLYLAGGEGLAANPAAALNWLVLAWKGGHPEAAREMAERLHPGAVSNDARTDYVAACREAAASGFPAAHFALGNIYRQAGQHEAAVESFRRAAEAGHAGAAQQLGELLVGDAKLEPQETGRRWLEEAVSRGEASAVRPLADLLWRAGDVAAEPWLRQLAQEGDTEAMARLAERLLQAPTSERLREARRWLAGAARRDHPRALWLLGRLHARWLRGPELEGAAPHSPQKAVEYLARAAAQNVAEAHWDLAQIYEQPGHAGRDLRLARLHLEAAAHAGTAPAQVKLARRLIARRDDPEAWLEAGHWLHAAREARETREEAETLIDAIADRAPPWPAAVLARQAQLLPQLAQTHPRLAAHLGLAARFGLTTREALFIDPSGADQGWCLLADLRHHFSYKPWRLVRVETEEQRAALRAAVAPALPPFKGEQEAPEGTTRARARRLASLLYGARIDPALFIRDWQTPS